MWTATTIGFFSVVRDRQVKGGVLVRARAKADIWNLYRQFSTAYQGGRGRRFKMTKPRSDEHRDYRWRIAMKQRDWAAICYRLAQRIDYHNFKDAVHEQPDQANKNSAYLSIWSAMLRVQHMEDPDWRKQPHQPYFHSWERELELARIGDGQAVEAEPSAADELERALEERSKRLHELSDADFQELEDRGYERQEGKA